LNKGAWWRIIGRGGALWGVVAHW